MAGERRTSIVRRFSWLFLGLWLAALVLSTIIVTVTLPATPVLAVVKNHVEARSAWLEARWLSLELRAARGEGTLPSSPAELLATLTAHAPPREGGADFILGADGHILARRPSNVLPVSGGGIPVGTLVVVGPSLGAPGLFNHTVAFRRPLGRSGLHLLVEQRVSIDLVRPADRPGLGLQRALLMVALSTGFLVLGAILAGRVVTRPLELVREGAHRIAAGDLSHRIHVTSADEVGDLARDFNQMAERLGLREQELREKNAELERANQMKTMFLANVSHELRTPLTSIMGFSQMLRDGVHGSLNGAQEEVVDKVTRNATALLALINDLLDLSRIEAGKMELTLTTVSLAECLESAWSAVEPQGRDRGIAFVPEMPEEPVEVRGDFNRLRQAFVNLLSNAVKFTEVGQVGVRLRSLGDVAEVEVWDTGVGIDADAMAGLFDEFRRVERGGVEGSGLGLAICRRIVRLHDGDVTVRSEPGRGSTFAVRLPRGQVPMSSAQGGLDGASGEAAPGAQGSSR